MTSEIVKITEIDVMDENVSSENEHLQFCEEQIVKMNVGELEIFTLDVIENSKFDREYEESLKRIKNPEEKYLIHGTSHEAAIKIAKEGFKVGGTEEVPIKNGAAYGNGVYFSENFQTGLCYSGIHRGKQLMGQSILLCKVITNECLIRKKSKAKKNQKHFYVIPDIKCIKPMYILWLLPPSQISGMLF